MPSKIKIIIFIDQLAEKGGIERLVALKANYWTEEFGFDVSIVSTEQRGRAFSFAVNNKVKVVDLGINYHRNISYFHPRNLVKFIRNIFTVKSLIKSQKPTHLLVASHIPITYIINSIKRDAKTIKEYHYTKYNSTLGSYKQKQEYRIENLFDFNVILSEEETQYHKLKNMVVIPNPIELKPSFALNPNSVPKKKMFFLGRIAPVKNLESLLRIWSKFISLGYQDWQLDIMGDYDNAYGQKLKGLVNELSLTRQVCFLGNVDQPTKIFHNYHAMLMTSLHECFPMVILESFAQAVPVISYDCPTGPRNMITNGVNGILVENANEDQFVEHLIAFAQSDFWRLEAPKNARIEAAKYNLDVIMNRWKNEIFYHEMD